MNSNNKYLSVLHTRLGKRDLYDSVSYCNRCGMCAPVCPAYQQDPKESNSPRGRNQAFRLLLEGKLKINKNRKELTKLVTTCTLCGRCMRVCPGQIPTAEHMLELRRRLKLEVFPRLCVLFLRLRQDSPRAFAICMIFVRIARRLGLVQFLSDIPGLTWLQHMHAILPMRMQRPFRAAYEPKPTLIYLPSLEAEFLVPQIATQVYQLAGKKYRVSVWGNRACGLFEYVYGDLQRARARVRDLISLHASTGTGNLPLLTDSIDVYLFLKRSPQLFEGFTIWQKKATQFASQVRFVTDLFPQKSKQTNTVLTPVMLMNSALWEDDSSVCLKAEQILQTLFKKNLVQCGYKEATLPPLGYSFTTHTCAAEYQMQAVRTVAVRQIQTVFVLSGLAALELNAQLRRFYPTAQACHIVTLNG